MRANILISLLVFIQVHVIAQPDLSNRIFIDKTVVFRDKINPNIFYYNNLDISDGLTTNATNLQLTESFITNRLSRNYDVYHKIVYNHQYKMLSNQEFKALERRIKMDYNATVLKPLDCKIEFMLMFGKTNHEIDGYTKKVALKGDAEQLNLGKRVAFFSSISNIDFELLRNSLLTSREAVVMSYIIYAKGICNPSETEAQINRTRFQLTPTFTGETKANWCSIAEGLHTIKINQQDTNRVFIRLNLDKYRTLQHPESYLTLSEFANYSDSVDYGFITIKATGAGNRQYEDEYRIYTEDITENGLKHFKFKYPVFINRPVTLRLKLFSSNGLYKTFEKSYDVWPDMFHITEPQTQQ